MNDYKRLGDYIREVNVRNRDLKVNLSQGICNDKYFQNPKQVADNPETHKIVRTGQFAYNRATTRNGDKLSIALRKGPDCTVSAAYQVFEVSRPDLLLPKYLMMWFKRPEFDRLALFYSHGSAHEFFEWESMCDVKIPLPDIERQREIVEEYETLTKRIRLNEQMIARLEATAQALYRHTFIDNIDKQNLPLFDIAEITYGFPFNSDLFCNDNTLSPIIRIRDILSNKTETFTSEHVDKKYEINDGDILIGMDGAFHMTIWSGGFALQNQRIVKIVPKKGKYVSAYQIFYSIYDAIKQLESSIEGTTVAHLSDKDMRKLSIIVSSAKTQEKTYSLFETINKSVITYKKGNLKLTELQSLLLSKMGQ